MKFIQRLGQLTPTVAFFIIVFVAVLLLQPHEHQLQYNTLSLQPSIIVFVSYIIITILHIYLPSFTADGYVCHQNDQKPLQYRLNGPLMQLVAVVMFLYCPLTWQALFYNNFFQCLTSACVFGLIGSGILYMLGIICYLFIQYVRPVFLFRIQIIMLDFD